MFLKYGNVTFNDIKEVFILPIETDLDRLTVEGDGKVITFDRIGSVITLEISYAFSGISFNLKNANTIITTMRIFKNEFEYLMSNNKELVSVSKIYLIPSIEAYALTVENALMGNNYDRGLNDGLILGQMI